MKVLCIDSDFREMELTSGKWYDVINSIDHNYTIVNDQGITATYYNFRFKTVDQVRDDKLGSLGLED